jgi:geranylgeranyl diphosphate synthase type I
MSASAELAAAVPHARVHPRPRPGRTHPAPGGLRADAGLADVEALLELLAGDGYAGEMAREHLSGGGKRLRARLALAATEALGGMRRGAIAWAAACEMLHNATLVHDDLQDGDTMRRGRPATWVRHGAAQAVNAGDLMLMLPFQALDHLPAPGALRWALASSLARHAAEAARGQSAEMRLVPGGDVTWAAYRHAVAGKTAALFALPVEGAALLAGRDEARARALGEAFRGIGVLFQLQDDVLDLYGDKGRGVRGSDLYEGKASALAVEHLALHPAERPWLLNLLSLPRGETPHAAVARAMERFREGGALAAVLRRIADEAAAVAASPALRAEPALAALADELARVALAPIAHLADASAEAAR